MSQPPPGDGDGPAPGKRAWLGRVLAAARGGVTAAATLITAALGVVFLLVPSLRPLPRDKIEASLSVPAFERSVPLPEWADRQYPGRGPQELRRLLRRPVKADDSATTGIVVYVRLTADGFKRRSIQLRARVYDACTGRPPENSDPEPIYPEAGTLSIDAPSRSSVQLLLLDDFLALGGRFFVRVEAFDAGGILAYADSDRIGEEPCPRRR